MGEAARIACNIGLIAARASEADVLGSGECQKGLYGGAGHENVHRLGIKGSGAARCDER